MIPGTDDAAQQRSQAVNLVSRLLDSALALREMDRFCAAYLPDTLAEVHLRLGQPARAVFIKI